MYEQVIKEKFAISISNVRNKYLILETNDIVRIETIIGKCQVAFILLEVIKCNNSFLIFDKPILSSVVGFFYVDTISISNLFVTHLLALKYKICIFITSALLHTQAVLYPL